MRHLALGWAERAGGWETLMSLRQVVTATQHPPLSEQWRDQMLDAVILAAAVVARADAAGTAAARMCLLVETRRAGLVGTPPHRDVLAAFAVQSAALTHPTAARRIVSRTMNAFVGTPWAEPIAAIAARVADASRGKDAALRALAGVRRALGLSVADLC